MTEGGREQRQAARTVEAEAEARSRRTGSAVCFLSGRTECGSPGGCWDGGWWAQRRGRRVVDAGDVARLSEWEDWWAGGKGVRAWRWRRRGVSNSTGPAGPERGPAAHVELLNAQWPGPAFRRANWKGSLAVRVYREPGPGGERELASGVMLRCVAPCCAPDSASCRTTLHTAHESLWDCVSGQLQAARPAWPPFCFGRPRNETTRARDCWLHCPSPHRMTVRLRARTRRRWRAAGDDNGLGPISTQRARDRCGATVAPLGGTRSRRLALLAA